MNDKRLFYLLNLAQQRAFKWTNTESKKEIGISTTQIAAVFYLQQNDGCQLKQLGKGLSLNQPAITSLVERMENNGLVKRKPCVEDARSTRVHLTVKGKGLGEKALLKLEEYNNLLREGFSDAEIEIVLRFLNITAEKFKR